MIGNMKTSTFNHKSCTDMTQKPFPNAYKKSKKTTEHTTWEFYNNRPKGYFLEMTVINPGAVLVLALSLDIEGVSLNIMAQILKKCLQFQI